MNDISLRSFMHELEKIGMEKDAGLFDAVRRASGWMRGEVRHLNLAAGQAMEGYQTVNPITSQPSPPVLGTLRNYIANKMPAQSGPPSRLAAGVARVVNSKPVQKAVPVLDQASEFLKLAGRARPLPKTEKCAKCSRPATKRVFWCEHRAYQPVCDNHVSSMEKHLSKQNGGPVDSIEKLAQVSPYQQKTQYSCSAACLKSVLEHWGSDRFAEHEIMRAIDVSDKGGAEVDQITAAAQALGFEAYDKSFSSLDEARQITDRDIPIIADLQSFNKPGSGHYVVITKIDDNVVHLMDPNTDGNQRVVTRSEMEQRWWDRRMQAPHDLMPKWGIVVTPRTT